jgi:hypothetical protein
MPMTPEPQIDADSENLRESFTRKTRENQPNPRRCA